MKAFHRLLFGFLVFTLSSFAGTIVGGSNLITIADVNQLEAWLGEGSLKLTNIFDMAELDGKTADDFHAAADGKGRTFTILRVRNADTLLGPFSIIGGYNPQSWNSIAGFYPTATDAERTAFIFNLSTSTRQSQRLTTDPTGPTYGTNQTLNHPSYGPAFGGPQLDLKAEYNLPDGSLYQYAYGSCASVAGGCTNILGDTGSTYLYISDIEVFSIEPAAVPEPGTWAMMGAGLTAVIAFRRRRS